ncbi:DinB family protein [Nigerium massiliense]|uniref:DinB family protein n=1 Tax=Nigerium massiliense TaxID=1522317 RepID=UPI00058DF030|nr:DinB family protein [Nigerium massiliense]
MDTDVLLRYLTAARTSLIWKVEGLSEREARWPRTRTGTSLAGLVKHCALVEHGYFGEVLGRDPGIEVPGFGHDDDPNADLYLTEDETVGDIIALYRRVGDYVTKTVRELPLDTPGHVPWWGPRGETTLGALLVHVTYDVSRHAGQADILRELADCTVGLTQVNDNLGVPPEGWDAQRARLEDVAGRFR